MDKLRKYFLSPDRNEMHCEVFINGRLALNFRRHLKSLMVLATREDVNVDPTTFDLELHAFLRLSHQYMINPDCFGGEKLEEMFEIDCPNI